MWGETEDRTKDSEGEPQTTGHRNSLAKGYDWGRLGYWMPVERERERKSTERD